MQNSCNNNNTLKMDYFCWELLMLILDENLSDDKWHDIIGHMVRHCEPKEVNHVFSMVISQGNLRLIKIFSENGIDAFEKAKDDKDEDSAPPIFSLVGCEKKDISPQDVLDTIHSGWKTYRINGLSSLYRGNLYKKTVQKFTERYDGLSEMMTLLNEAIMEGDMKLADFLIEFSDVEASNPLSNWSVLHCAVLTDNEKLIEIFLNKGLDPYDEGSMYHSEWETIKLAHKYFEGDKELCQRAFYEKDCFEIARMRKPSNYAFLKSTHDKLKDEKNKVETSDSSEEYSSEKSIKKSSVKTQKVQKEEEEEEEEDSN